MTGNDEYDFIAALKRIVSSARSQAYAAVNFAQVKANWLIGRQIVEQEQRGKKRAEYGAHIIEIASRELSAEFGKGFSEKNLKSFRKFYLVFSALQIGETLSPLLSNNGETPSPLSLEMEESQSQRNKTAFPERFQLLSWSHYERLMRVESREAREWYIT